MRYFIGKVFLILFIISNLVLSQNKFCTLTVFVVDKSQEKAKDVFITGDKKYLGEWDPSQIKLKKLTDSTWTINFEITENTEIKYKFTQGTWETESLTKEGSVHLNSFVKIINDTVITHFIENWKRGKNIISSTITGNIKIHKDIKYKNLEKRDIIIWLPPSYEKNIIKRYPVFYMHDGQNLFDASNSFSKAEWRADETADSLIKNGEIKEIIIVGINNTKNRRTEYSKNDTGNVYSEFIIKHLKPFIDKTYRTLSDRKNTAIAGSSMGGYISMMIGWEHPEIFSMIGAISPAIKYKVYNYLPYIEKYKGKKKNLKIYVDNGTKLDEELQNGVDELLKLLDKKGYKKGKDLLYIKDSVGNHNEVAWANRLPIVLKYFFGTKSN